MFDQKSRYYTLENAEMTVKDRDGKERKLVYKKRRFIPSPEDMTTLLEHTVTQGERLDNLTAKYLGDPLQFWRVCDASTVLNPEELTKETGRKIRIALPQM